MIGTYFPSHGASGNDFRRKFIYRVFQKDVSEVLVRDGVGVERAVPAGEVRI